MNSLELISQQRQKETRILKFFLASSLVGSLAFHAGAMTLRVGNFERIIPAVEPEAEIEVTITDENLEEPMRENLAIAESLPEPEIPQAIAFAPDVPPPPIPLAPVSQAPLTPGEDAPSKESSPTTDAVPPLTNAAGDTPTTGGASGSINSSDGKGSGFGNAAQPTGFAPGGKPDGSPDGRPGGTLDGKPGGQPGQTAVRSTPPPPAPVRSQEPICVSCPKPKFQGQEGSPRVDLKIRPDGSVEVRLRKTSGNPEVDRATLETMSKWHFDPQSVPKEGVRKRVRVTYEEEGSAFQRQNEQRRRQEAKHRQIVEQERQQREVMQPSKTPASAILDPPPAKPVPVDPPPEAKPTPIAAPPPAPVYAPPPPPAPEPPPEPVYAPPPAPVEAPASDGTVEGAD
ncbi:MAG: TonB family protein [Leptodesmis sp.]|uniref:energy transducer TonB family protein n=1 Tax=Leptodesmis sp. TaxID=3100501 RepID=UPI003D099117